MTRIGSDTSDGAKYALYAVDIPFEQAYGDLGSQLEREGWKGSIVHTGSAAKSAVFIKDKDHAFDLTKLSADAKPTISYKGTLDENF